jgi:hypothetical protein
MRGFTDYRMAKRALVRQVTRGTVPVTDVCDAHPELMQAARNVGAVADRRCPICRIADRRAEIAPDGADNLRLVTYVFGDGLRRKSGLVVWTRDELDQLAARHDSLSVYQVECCLVCGWNYLMASYLLGVAHAG